MTKKFANIADDGVEKAIRRGFTVPKGAVNLSWVKAPALSPSNNVVIIDTSRVIPENASVNTKSKKVAFANALGILEDVNGNEIWDEEYPIISDLFIISETDIKQEDYKDEQILPFLHVSRHFHIDYGGLAQNSLEKYDDLNVKVVNKKGQDHVDADGKRRYKVYIAQPANISVAPNSTQSAYRVHVFLDMNIDTDELYLTYNKVELTSTGGLKLQESDYRELVNPRPYFKYIPEESEVIDRSSITKRIYSSKPSNLKQQMLGLPHQDSFGWKYTVPRKAIPDPRIFQTFRWRLACELTQPIVQKVDDDTPLPGTFPVVSGNPTVIRAGVVIPPGGNHFSTRSNFFFYELNQSDYNLGGVKFVNPLRNPNFNSTDAEQQVASYWHVDLTNISLLDLAKFDVLIWAPTATDANANTKALTAKINYFIENVGGTFIFETSSLTTFPVDFTNASFSPVITEGIRRVADDNVVFSTYRIHDDTPTNPLDTFNTFGMWKLWPPNVSEILNEYQDIGSILASSDVIAGWALTSDELNNITGYQDIPDLRSQYIYNYGSDYRIVVEASTVSGAGTYKPVMIHRKTNSGGNIFISTGAFFEDHIFNINGTLAVGTLGVPAITSLSTTIQQTFKQMVSSVAMAGEMKFRFNIMLLATINKPSPADKINGQAINNGNSQSITIYSDWFSSWVIDASNDVLTEKEKTDNKFALLPTSPESEDPVWQRILSPKTLKQITQEKIKQLDPNGVNPYYNTFEGATRRYFLMTTNPAVQVLTTTQLQDSSPPTAWTFAYTPKFEVPVHLGSYVVRDEMVSGGIGPGEGKRIYPPKPYDLQASLSYLNDARIPGTINTVVSLNGTAKKYIKAPDMTEVRHIWVPPEAGTMVDVAMHWTTDGANSQIGPYHQMGSYHRDYGIDTWNAVNYYAATHVTVFPYANRNEIMRLGYRGSLTRLVQLFLNLLIADGGLTGPLLLTDSIYGPATEAKVTEFQMSRQSRYIDGIVGVDFWAMMGYTLMYYYNSVPNWIGAGQPDLVDYARQCLASMRTGNFSDGDSNSHYGSISSGFDSPSTIKEGFLITFNNKMPIYRLSVMPWIVGATNNLDIDWVDVTSTYGHNFEGYSFTQGNPGPIVGKNGGDGWWINISFPEVVGDTIIFRASQSGGMGEGYQLSRFIGIREAVAYSKRFVPGASGYYYDETIIVPGATYQIDIPITYQVPLTFQAGVPITISSTSAFSDFGSVGQVRARSDIEPFQEQQQNTVGYVKFDFTTLSISSNQSSFTSTTVDNPLNNAITLTYNGYLNLLTSENFVAGSRLGNGTTSFFTKTETGIIDPYLRNRGWITKDNGLKLLCTAAGKPIGFPEILPSSVSTSAHFARFKLNSFNTDQTIFYGFYDVVRKEFITDAYGFPEISYYDYIRRGPQNIFFAVKTTYELDTTVNVPGTSDFVQRPFRWAMPVYGVTIGLKPKIQIEPLSADLGVHDMWSIPIKTGVFSRDIVLRKKSEASYTNYLKDYQGTTVSAYYDIPEARSASWSPLYGRPYIDIKGEIPIILDDDTIKVRQFPILINQTPTASSGPADPWLPVFKVYRRASLSDSWIEVPFTSIKDYDAVHGTIILNTPLTNNDPRLVKVDYTSERKVFDLKHDGTNKINLNPYTNNRPDWIDKPLYLYLLPEYILDAQGSLIAASVRSRTIQLTDSSTIFNLTQADYMPEASLLGIIYISSAFEINDLIMLDTRRRGGGVSTDYVDAEAMRKIPEFDSFWDVNPDKAVSYQNGGFVIVRLPAALKTDFTENQVRAIIDRNITIGVRYKIEDLEGNRWNT